MKKDTIYSTYCPESLDNQQICSIIIAVKTLREETIMAGKKKAEEVKKEVKPVETKAKKAAATVKKAPAKAKAAVKATAKKVEDKAVAEKIEVKKATTKAAREVRETKAAVKKAAAKVESAVKKPAAKIKAAKLEIYIQSPLGGNITPEEIAAKLPKGAESVFVRVDQNKLWWIRGEESGSVDIW